MLFRLLNKRPLFLHSLKRPFPFRHPASTTSNSTLDWNNKFSINRHIYKRKLFEYYRYDPSVMAYSTPSEPTKQNRLANERSPYLLQHAHNPVDWYPWGIEAIDKAVSLNRPIFLSIGYSTCHWCHVMERESFENECISEYLNNHFISIKLDREERPDLDKIYMSYVVRVSGGGGWPLTLFLTPSLEPIFGGTYFPPEDGNNRIGFKTLLQIIASQWRDQHALIKIEAHAAIKEVKAEVDKKISSVGSDIPGASCWEKCFQQLHGSYESTYGGFSNAPKFPQTVGLNLLFTMQSRYKSSYLGQKCLEMALFTLKRIAYGGIHDHVGYGFSRYSVDKRWHVPHFEKMLYDQSQLVMTYLDAYLITKQDLYANIAKGILKYVGRDLSHNEGGFYSAEDADSFPTSDATVKKEGAFYVWTMEEIKKLLSDEKERAIFCHHFTVQDEGNVDAHMDPHNELLNQNVLFCNGSFTKTATHFELPGSEIQTVLQKCLDVLFEARGKRPRPSVDTKIVAAWNGFMIAAYAKAAFILKDESYELRAIKAANFVRTYLRSEDGSLLRCCYGNDDAVEQIENPIGGLLDDYAFMIRGLIYLYECTLDGQWLEWAEELQALQDLKFWDSENGSYYNSHGDDPYAIIRDKEDQDGAEPCGNSVSAHNLIRLAHYMDQALFRNKAKRIFQGYSKLLNAIPVALPEMISALIHFQTTPLQIIIAGQRDEPDTQALLNVVREQYLPGRVLMLADGPEGKSEVLYKRHKTLESIRPVNGQAAAYVCKRFACTLPTTNPEALERLLSTKGKDQPPAGTSSSSD